MDYFIIAFVVFLGSNFYARSVMSKAVLKLNTDEKVKLLDLSSKNNNKNIIIIVVFLAIYFGLIYLNVLDPTLIFILFGITMTGYYVYSSYQQLILLKNMEIDEAYIAEAKKTSFIKIVGLVLFFILMALN